MTRIRGADDVREQRRQPRPAGEHERLRRDREPSSRSIALEPAVAGGRLRGPHRRDPQVHARPAAPLAPRPRPRGAPAAARPPARTAPTRGRRPGCPASGRRPRRSRGARPGCPAPRSVALRRGFEPVVARANHSAPAWTNSSTPVLGPERLPDRRAPRATSGRRTRPPPWTLRQDPRVVARRRPRMPEPERVEQQDVRPPSRSSSAVHAPITPPPMTTTSRAHRGSTSPGRAARPRRGSRCRTPRPTARRRGA